MSGQRNKKPSDVIKHRQEYLDNLSLQVQLNDANEQAIRQFKETGQVPPISQMKDTRTTTQILLDVEKLKINLAFIIPSFPLSKIRFYNSANKVNKDIKILLQSL